MEHTKESINAIKAYIKAKGHTNINEQKIELYFRFLFENQFINSKLLLEVFQRDFFEINLDVIDSETLEVKDRKSVV